MCWKCEKSSRNRYLFKTLFATSISFVLQLFCLLGIYQSHSASASWETNRVLWELRHCWASFGLWSLQLCCRHFIGHHRPSSASSCVLLPSPAGWHEDSRGHVPYDLSEGQSSCCSAGKMLPSVLSLFCRLDLIPLFCKGSLSQQLSNGWNKHRADCEPLVQRCQQIWWGNSTFYT